MPLLRRIQWLLRDSFAASQRMSYYVAEAAVRPFSPSDDRYPATGVQPFTGTPIRKKRLA